MGAPRPVDERFWAKVNRDGPVHPTLGTACWLWTAYIRPNGYGAFMPVEHECRYAHRFAFALVKGEIPPGLQLDHLCRVRHCVNPAHLEAVTLQENLLRSPLTLQSIHLSRTHCPQGHPYSGDNLYTDRNGGRACRTCRKAVNDRRARTPAAPRVTPA